MKKAGIFTAILWDEEGVDISQQFVVTREDEGNTIRLTSHGNADHLLDAIDIPLADLIGILKFVGVEVVFSEDGDNAPSL